MLIRKINLKNFRQYYDENIINLSTDEEKNVSVIHGENGVGKTAMLNGIKWAFFGDFTENFRSQNNLINNTAVRNGVKSCSVEIEFEEDDQLFHLIRRFDSTTNKTELKIFKIDNGVFSASLPEPELVINGMLPREMGEYFFFQGEGSNAVATGSSSGDITQAIRDIMGFKVANKLTESLKKALSDNKRLITSQDTSGKSTQLNVELEKLNYSIEQYTKKLDEIKSRIPNLEEELEETEKSLLMFSNVELQSLKKEELETTTQLKRKRLELEDLKERKISLINKYGWAVFGVKLANKSQDFIDENELKGKLPEPYNETFIKDILGKEECICGACLTVGSSAYEKVVSLLGKASNPQLTNRLKGIRTQIQAINTLCDGAAEEISNTNKDYDNADEQVLFLINKLEGINSKIIQIPEDKIRSLQNLKMRLDADIKSSYIDIGNYQSRLERSISNKKSIDVEMSKLTGSTSIIQDLKLKEKFINELLEYIESYLIKAENDIRLHVLDKVNKTLDQFSRHDFKIKVEPNSFRIHLLDKDGGKVGQGDGLNLLLNLTITASLIQFAASQKKVKDPILSSATVAPLVIDAPFGVLDNKYRNVVVKLLPEYANQIIFLVSSSQWTEEMDKVVRNKIGKEYILVLEETSEQGARELDVVNIGVAEHVASRYGCEVDRTVIKEVVL